MSLQAILPATHPLLDARAFISTFPEALSRLPVNDTLSSFLQLDNPAPMCTNDEVKVQVRNLLRHGGFKPAGRSKPASEYLIGAATSGFLSPINPAVDACNAVSLHSGLPISVINLETAEPPFEIRIATEGEEYVFNASGQVIDLSGLLCLFDVEGPCANAVKDSQRTKTTDTTTQTLTVIWGTNALPGRSDQACSWYREILGAIGVDTRMMEIDAGDE